MISSLFSQEGKYKGGRTSNIKDNVGRRTYGLFIYTPQGRMWAENLGEVFNNIRAVKFWKSLPGLGGKRAIFDMDIRYLI